MKKLNFDKLNESDMKNRAEYVQLLIKNMKIDIEKENNIEIKKLIKKEYNGRMINVILRGYDIPLQGSTTITCKHMKAVLPTPLSVQKQGYFKNF